MNGMITAHIDERLEQDRKIFRPMSFHALMDLLTFGQLGFNRVHPLWREGLAGSPMAGVPRRAPPRGQAVRPARGALALQSWTLLPAGGLDDWRETDQARPHVCVVSSVGAMARALVAPEGATVHIECPGTPPAAARHGAAGLSHVNVIVRNPRRGKTPSSGCLRLHVDLSTLVQEVVVSSGAPGRFAELVAKLVQANTPAPVNRACRETLPAPALPVPRRQADPVYRASRSGTAEASNAIPEAVSRLSTMRRKATSLIPV